MVDCPRGISMSQPVGATSRRAMRAVFLTGTSALVLTVLGGFLPVPTFAIDSVLKAPAGTADEICRAYGADSQECIAALAALTPGIGQGTNSNDRAHDGKSGEAGGG